MIYRPHLKRKTNRIKISFVNFFLPNKVMLELIRTTNSQLLLVRKNKIHKLNLLHLLICKDSNELINFPRMWDIWDVSLHRGKSNLEASSSPRLCGVWSKYKAAQDTYLMFEAARRSTKSRAGERCSVLHKTRRLRLMNWVLLSWNFACCKN